jgi:hypothetical protein
MIRWKARYRCVVCGKVTAGRVPYDGRFRGDGTQMWPRRHQVDGKDCPGNVEAAEWVDIPVEAAAPAAQEAGKK